MAPKMITEEDVDIVKELVLIPIILDVLERDIKSIQGSELKMKEVYTAMLVEAQDKVTASYYEIRKAMRANGIKITKEWRDDKMVHAEFVCRGYNRDFSMLWSYVKAEIQTRLSGHLGLKSFG